jgi:hypothetical protein
LFPGQAAILDRQQMTTLAESAGRWRVGEVREQAKIVLALKHARKALASTALNQSEQSEECPPWRPLSRASSDRFGNGRYNAPGQGWKSCIDEPHKGPRQLLTAYVKPFPRSHGLEDLQKLGRP